MNLRSYYPYSLLKYGIIRSYLSLRQNLRAEVAIIGAGITGALVAWELSKAGIKIIIVDRRHIGMGSTAACTSLLQYEIDISLSNLIKKRGYKNAVRSYHLCRQSIYDLGLIFDQLNNKSEFLLKPSLQFASFKKHVKILEEEFKLRRRESIPVNWMDENDIIEKYGFHAPAGILSRDGAEVDAIALLMPCYKKAC